MPFPDQTNLTYKFDGPTVVKVDTGALNALENLGYSADGIQIEERMFHSDVPVDLNGGPEGPPGDVQFMGSVHIITFRLTKFYDSVLDKITPYLYGGTNGQIPDPGSFMSSNGFRLLLYPDDYASGSNNPRNYPLAFPRGSISFNKGTKYRAVQMTWEAHATVISNELTMWNATDS